MPGQMAETALVVLVPAADALVARARRHHDPAAAVGVPAHVTVLYPFRPDVDGDTDAVVAALAASVPAFDVTFATMARFPGGVVYLAPAPVEPFLRLTAAAAAAFPDWPPYGGAFADVVPHLTVADGIDEPTADAVERSIRPGLPVTAPVSRLTLLARGAAGRWRVARFWPLG